MNQPSHSKPADAKVKIVSDTEAQITRVFHAPRALVWEAMTNPEHVRHWYGPYSTQITSCEMDLRVGGKWRIVMTSEQGEAAFSGEYLEIDAPARLVQTWRFELIEGAESVESLTLEEHDGKTYFTALVKHKSKENLQGHLQSGMEAGMQETYRRLDELLTKLSA